MAAPEAGGQRAHPALRAWTQLVGDASPPRRIERITGGYKIWVYVLEGAGPGGQPVVAKRTRTPTVELERRIYQEILAEAPIASLALHGSVPDPDPGFAWLFLEHAGEEGYAPTDPGHRRGMARWLAGLHAHAAGSRGAADWLPERGPGHYRLRLRAARERIRSRLDEGQLARDDGALLERVGARFDGLEAAWSVFETICARFPATLVHGDLSAKNVRLRASAAGVDVVAFDWEMAGWGPAAPDLARLDLGAQGSLVAPDLTIYAAALERAGIRRSESELRALAAVGSIFRVVALIDWMAWAVAPGMPGWGMPTLGLYDGILGRIAADPDLGLAASAGLRAFPHS